MPWESASYSGSFNRFQICRSGIFPGRRFILTMPTEEWYLLKKKSV